MGWRAGGQEGRRAGGQEGRRAGGQEGRRAGVFCVRGDVCLHVLHVHVLHVLTCALGWVGGPLQNLRVGCSWRSVLGPLARAVLIHHHGLGSPAASKERQEEAAAAAVAAYHLCPNFDLLVSALMEEGPEGLSKRWVGGWVGWRAGGHACMHSRACMCVWSGLCVCGGWVAEVG